MPIIPVKSIEQLIESLKNDLRDNVDRMAIAAAESVRDIVEQKYVAIDDKMDNLGPVVPEFKIERIRDGVQAIIFVREGRPTSLKARKLNFLKSPTPFGSTWNELQSKKIFLGTIKGRGIE